MAKEPAGSVEETGSESDERKCVSDGADLGTDAIIERPYITFLEEGCHLVGPVFQREYNGWER